MIKLIFLVVAAAACAQAAPGLLGGIADGHAPLAVAAPVAVAHAPIAVAHAPIAVAHAPVATSYANQVQLSKVSGVAVAPVAVKTVTAPIAIKTVAAPIAIKTVAAAPIAISHGGLGLEGYGLGGYGLH